jgi:hypothetical protein
MTLLWWKWHSCRNSSGTSPRSRKLRPRLEPLEDRALPSAAALLFDPASGGVAIRDQSSDDTVQEAVTGGDFLEITIDGQRHSSDPSSAFFDNALAGATGSTLRGLSFDSGGHNTLILGPQKLPGSLTVLAPDAAVDLTDVTTVADLTIQADSITVAGALHASAVTLAGSSMVTIETRG